jgi:hypothetical protein
VALDGTAPALREPLQATLDGVERVANGDVHVLMRMVFGAATVRDNDLTLRDVEIDADSVRVSLVLVVMRRLDHDAAARDVVEQLFQLIHPVADLRVDGFRGREAAACDLKWQLHAHLLAVRVPGVEKL